MTQGNALPLAVKRLLAEGYGVEDIALKLYCKPGAVKTVIRDMLFAGELAGFYANARVKWRSDGLQFCKK